MGLGLASISTMKYTHAPAVFTPEGKLPQVRISRSGPKNHNALTARRLGGLAALAHGTECEVTWTRGGDYEVNNFQFRCVFVSLVCILNSGSRRQRRRQLVCPVSLQGMEPSSVCDTSSSVAKSRNEEGRRTKAASITMGYVILGQMGHALLFGVHLLLYKVTCIAAARQRRIPNVTDRHSHLYRRPVRCMRLIIRMNELVPVVATAGLLSHSFIPVNRPLWPHHSRSLVPNLRCRSLQLVTCSVAGGRGQINQVAKQPGWGVFPSRSSILRLFLCKGLYSIGLSVWSPSRPARTHHSPPS